MEDTNNEKKQNTNNLHISKEEWDAIRKAREKHVLQLIQSSRRTKATDDDVRYTTYSAAY